MTTQPPHEITINPSQTYHLTPRTMSSPPPDIVHWTQKLKGKRYLGPTRPQADQAHLAATEEGGDGDEEVRMGRKREGMGANVGGK